MNQQNQIQYVEQDAERMIRTGAISRAQRRARNWMILYPFSLTAFAVGLAVAVGVVVKNGPDAGKAMGGLAILLAMPVEIFRRKMQKARGEYRRSFKQVYVQSFLKPFFSDLSFQSYRGIAWADIAGTMIFYSKREALREPRCDWTHHPLAICTNDYICAAYKDVRFEESDVRIKRHRFSHLYETVFQGYTVFRGQWMIFHFNKRFKGNIMIVQRGFRNTKLGGFHLDRNRFQSLEMESEVFNREFRVYAQNAHTAFYLITPPLIERIQKLAAQSRGKLLFCFSNHQLHIVIQSQKDIFEPGSPFRRVHDELLTQKIRSEIEAITGIVDELSLNGNLFVKED